MVILVAAVITVTTTPLGWPLLALGTVVLLLILVSWFYWSATRSLREQVEQLSVTLDGLGSDNSGLADSVATLESDRNRLNDEVVVLRSTSESLGNELANVRSVEQQLTAQVRQLSAAVAELDEDRNRYEYAVRIMAERSRRNLVYLEQHIVYVIGANPAGDRITETYLTVAKDKEDALLWQDVSIGLTNQSSTVRSFRDLDQSSVFEVLPNPPPAIKPLEYLPTGFRDNKVGVLVFFDPEIDTTPREWRLTYRWQGMWDPLRARHRDTSILRLSDPHRIERHLVTVSFVFPLSSVAPRVKTGAGSPRITPEWKSDLQGRPVAKYAIVNPTYEMYDWVLEVDSIKSSAQ